MATLEKFMAGLERKGISFSKELLDMNRILVTISNAFGKKKCLAGKIYNSDGNLVSYCHKYPLKNRKVNVEYIDKPDFTTIESYDRTKNGSLRKWVESYNDSYGAPETNISEGLNIVKPDSITCSISSYSTPSVYSTPSSYSTDSVTKTQSVYWETWNDHLFNHLGL